MSTAYSKNVISWKDCCMCQNVCMYVNTHTHTHTYMIWYDMHGLKSLSWIFTFFKFSINDVSILLNFIFQNSIKITSSKAKCTWYNRTFLKCTSLR